MKVTELKKKNPDELQKLLSEKQELVRELRFQLESRQLKDVRALRQARRDIARILTLTNESRQIGDE